MLENGRFTRHENAVNDNDYYDEEIKFCTLHHFL